MVNEVVENAEVTGSKLNGEKSLGDLVIFPICPSLGEQSYLVLVAGGRWQVSSELVKVHKSWPGHHIHKK